MTLAERGPVRAVDRIEPRRPLEARYGFDEPEAKPKIETVNQLITALNEYQQTGRPLHLTHNILSTGVVSQFRDGFTDLLRIEARINKIYARPEIDSREEAFSYVVAGQLTKLGTPSGTKAKEDCQILLTRLYPFSIGEIPPEESENDKKNILSPDFLTAAMELFAFADLDEGAIPDQLSDPFALVNLGLVINPHDQENFGFKLPQTLLTVLEGLKYQESAKVLEDWIYKQISGPNADFCIGFLRTLAQLTAFLDRDSYVKLYATGEKEEIPLLPFQSFHRAIVATKNYLSRISGAEKFKSPLEEVEQLIVSKFYQIIKGPLQNEVSVFASQALAPSPDDLAFSFVEWAAEQGGNGDLNLQETARLGVTMLEQSGMSDAKAFCQMITELDEELGLGRAVTKEAVKLGLIIDTEGIFLREIATETLEALKIPWQDAAEIDFTRIIDPETDILKVYLTPGTYGPFCRGHVDFIQRILAYMDYQERLENPDSHIQRIILISPITDVTGVRDYQKDSAQIGRLSERVGSIMLHLADADRERIFITTALQALPAKAARIDRSIQDTGHAFRSKVQNDFEQAGLVMGLEIAVTGCFGIDEFQWQQEENRLELVDRPRQPRKVRRDCLGIGRYGYLIPTILNGNRFATVTEAETLVLTPGTPMTSSTEAIRKLQAGDASSFHAATVPYIRKHWDRAAIQKRRRNKPRKTEIPSVSKIYPNVIKEFEELIRQEELI